MAIMLKGLTSNLGQKITAVLMAMLLWLYVYTLQGPEVVNTFYAKVSIRNLPENTKVTSVLGNAKIILKGSKKFMDEITPESVKAYIDLLGRKPGTFQTDIKLDFPESVLLSSVDPDVVTVTLQQISTKELPIIWKFTNQSQLSVVVKNPVFTPQRLTISGPETEVQKIAKALVIIDMGLIKEGGSRLKLPYTLIDNSEVSHTLDQIEGFGVTSSFTTLDVEIQVDRPVRSRTIAVQAKTTGNLPTNMILTSLEVEPKNVNIQGDFETLNKIGRFISTLPVNLNGIVVDTTMTVGLNLPKGITSDVKTVKVTIRVEELQKKKIIINIDNIDNPDGLEYELARQEIEVDIEGPNSVVKDTHRGTGSVSLKGLAPGKYTLPVKIEGLPSEVTVLGNLTVEVTIK
jgi:YbbR domain-containing protein